MIKATTADVKIVRFVLSMLALATVEKTVGKKVSQHEVSSAAHGMQMLGLLLLRRESALLNLQGPQLPDRRNRFLGVAYFRDKLCREL